MLSESGWNMETPDKFKDACGVFGVYAPGEEVARLTYMGLFALQHRGQESAGMAVSDGSSVFVYKDMGLVSQVFDETALLSLSGHLSIGHVRYSTTGVSQWENSQPIHFSMGDLNFALAHNGNLVNSLELQSELESGGYKFRSSTDSEIIAALISLSGEKDIVRAFKKISHKLKGAYSLVILSEDKLYGVRDPFGIRPLSLGKLPGEGYIISSESCGLNIVGAEFVSDVSPGEIVTISDSGITREIACEPENPSLCIFEFIYFARPDSTLLSSSLYQARKTMGSLLSTVAPIDADMVIGIPDSGTPAAIGYAEASGIPFGEALIKNRYIGRTFIQPKQTSRRLGIKLKLNPLKEAIQGKRLIVIDDSIVRGNTSQKIVSLLRQSGAKEIHFRVSSPPVKWPCFYGIDTAKPSTLIAAVKDVDGIKDFIGADSLAFLPTDQLFKSTGCPKDLFCAACFNGEYPIPVEEALNVKTALE